MVVALVPCISVAMLNEFLLAARLQLVSMCRLPIRINGRVLSLMEWKTLRRC